MGTEPGQFGDYSFKITLLGLLCFAVAALTTIFAFFEDERETFTFFLAVVGGAAAVYVAYYAYQTLHQTAVRNLAQRSFELIDRLSEVDYVGVRRFITKEIEEHEYESSREKERASEIQQKIDNNIELHDKVHHLLGFLESLSQQIQRGFVDESILYEHCCYIVNNAYKNLRQYIEISRHSPFADELYIHVERLYDCWKDGNSLQRSGEKIKRLTSPHGCN